jgi:hypothetical protein
MSSDLNVRDSMKHEGSWQKNAQVGLVNFTVVVVVAQFENFTQFRHLAQGALLWVIYGLSRR